MKVMPQVVWRSGGRPRGSAKPATCSLPDSELEGKKRGVWTVQLPRVPQSR
jgi:hypothetical protein